MSAFPSVDKAMGDKPPTSPRYSFYKNEAGCVIKQVKLLLEVRLSLYRQWR